MRWPLGVLLYAMTCSCAPRLEPMVPRPDTRRIQMVHVDSTAIVSTMEILQGAMPNEAAVCYTGKLYDSTATQQDGNSRAIQVLELMQAAPAAHDSADAFHVWGPTCDAKAVAIGHSHPYNGHYGLMCDHSDEDAELMFVSPRSLVSLVWCGDGALQFLWQDGRRGATRWRPE